MAVVTTIFVFVNMLFLFARGLRLLLLLFPDSQGLLAEAISPSFVALLLDSSAELQFKALAASRFKGGRIGFSDLWCLPQTGAENDPGSPSPGATRRPTQASRPKPTL